MAFKHTMLCILAGVTQSGALAGERGDQREHLGKVFSVQWARASEEQFEQK